jgi:very-short-patch-repair endonuclease
MKDKFVPYYTDLTAKARKLRNNLTKAEKIVWYDYLKNHKHKFLRQKPIGNFITDFYCSKLKLVIEIDGESHVGEINEQYDKERTDYLENCGLKILRYWNDDVVSGLWVVVEMIEKEIKKREVELGLNPLHRG